MRVTANTAKLHRMEFDSFTEAVNWCDANKSASTAATQIDGKGYHSTGWSGTQSFEAAVNYAKSGYEKGRKEIEKFKAMIDQRLQSAHEARQEVVYDVVGSGGWDIGEVLTGVPECAIEWADTEIMERRQKGSGKIIKFLINGTVSWNVSTEVMARRGAACGALIDCLEHEGYRVEAESSFYVASYGSAEVDIRIPIKKAHEHLQIDQLAFALTCPAWLRRFGFVCIAKSGTIGRQLADSGSYGRPTDHDGEDLNADQADLYFPCGYGAERQWLSNETAVKWIKEQLALFGITLKESETK